MIVQPDFLEHWKINALSNAIGRLEAITAILSLWAHCQQRKAWKFKDNAFLIAGICKYSGDADKLRELLISFELIDLIDDDMFEVHDWAKTNSSLIHNWEAGKLGGRPRKNPVKTQGLSQGITLSKPEGKPIREEKIRLDKRREEHTHTVSECAHVGIDDLEDTYIDEAKDIISKLKKVNRLAFTEKNSLTDLESTLSTLYTNGVGKDEVSKLIDWYAQRKVEGYRYIPDVPDVKGFTAFIRRIEDSKERWQVDRDKEAAEVRETIGKLI